MALDLSPGKAALGNARLIAAIIEEMGGGVMPFDRFMELALYHPQWGYYRTPGRIGKSGDFLTSPAIHPMFGWAIAGWCHWIWVHLGSPPAFTVFEPGAGDGRLATSILDWSASRDDGFGKSLRYVAIEPHSPGEDDRVAWATPPLPVAPYGVVISNEFFDALPVKLFESSARGPVEIGVRWDGENFVETRLGVSDIEGAPTEGRFEISPRAYPIMRSLCGLVERGAVLTVDYGYAREELWAPWRLQGTLLTFYKHTSQESPYIRVGEQDLTAHVNFTELEAAADAEGFDTHGPVSQSEFLAALGLHAVVESSRGQMEEYLIRRRALEQLTDGAGLGRVRVLASTKGISSTPPGLEPT